MPDLLSIQNLLKSKPLGVSYNGPLDGKLSDELVSSIRDLELAISIKLKSIPILDKLYPNFKILDGSNLVVDANELKTLIENINNGGVGSGSGVNQIKDQQGIGSSNVKQNQDPNVGKVLDSNVKQIQQDINKNPFNIKYNGPVDGFVNDDLISVLKSVEDEIGKLTNATVLNKIVNNGNVVIQNQDLQNTFKLIEDYKKFLSK